MQQVSALRIVWTNAYNHQILPRRYPFPDVSIADLSVPDLERKIVHAYRLGSWWSSAESSHSAAFESEFDATNGTPVSDLRFVPGHEGKWLLSVSKGIWSSISLWELSETRGAPPLKRFEWSSPNCRVQSFLVNGDTASDATLAVSLHHEGYISIHNDLLSSTTRRRQAHVEILSLREDEGFRSICTIDSGLRPCYFHGDILVLCDFSDLSLITNWRTRASALLQPPQQPGMQTGMASMRDRGIQVVCTASTILVVRGRSITLFPRPPLTTGPPAVHAPLTKHSFGWVDGVVVAPIVDPPINSDSSLAPPLSILIRPEPDDPWAPAAHHALHLYVLRPASAASTPTSPPPTPYVFPPAHLARLPSTRGSLQCRDLHLGAWGTAVWVEPRDRSAAGLLHEQAGVEVVRRDERVVCARFRGVDGDLLDAPGLEVNSLDVPREAQARTLRTNVLNDWTALDYDEVQGVVAMGSARGRVVVCEFVGGAV
ncbi:hypothetical protein C8R44DRAFT_897700 [Mycena epipterygia]|nr:hypothetical protein C8R44DRAFT_897700 [Mycena epipterygia]